MNNLKSAIAEKVLEISASDSSDIKLKLEKINRFRDFTEACQTLIQKYPAIEDEFLRMIENNDFDARVASSRVDTIIRLSENNVSNTQSHENIEKDISKLEDIVEQLPSVTEKETTIYSTSSFDKENESIEENLPNTNSTNNNASSNYYSQNQIETPIQEIVKELPQEYIDEEKEKEYIDFEEITAEDEIPIESKNENINQPVEGILNPVNTSKKDTVKKIIQVCGIVAIIVALIFIIKFVINNWEILLWILGGCIIAAGVVWFLMRKSKEE
jgi:hypothetical protein